MRTVIRLCVTVKQRMAKVASPVGGIIRDGITKDFLLDNYLYLSYILSHYIEPCLRWHGKKKRISN
jgi:hypothetical protein